MVGIALGPHDGTRITELPLPTEQLPAQAHVRGQHPREPPRGTDDDIAGAGDELFPIPVGACNDDVWKNVEGKITGKGKEEGKEMKRKEGGGG